MWVVLPNHNIFYFMHTWEWCSFNMAYLQYKCDEAYHIVRPTASTLAVACREQQARQHHPLMSTSSPSNVLTLNKSSHSPLFLALLTEK